MDFEQVNIEYGRTLSNVSYQTKRMEFTKADGTTKVKLEFPIYEDQENLELFLKLIRTFRKTVEAYDLFTLLGEAEVYDRFKQCLGGDALDTWEALLVDEDQVTWDNNLVELIEVLTGDDSFEMQKDYILETRKPNNMSTRTWVLRMKAMNAYLPVLGLNNGEDAMSEQELVRVISRNIPNSWKARFKMVGGHHSVTVAQALKTLSYIEIEDKKMSQRNNSNRRLLSLAIK